MIFGYDKQNGFTKIWDRFGKDAKKQAVSISKEMVDVMDDITTRFSEDSIKNGFFNWDSYFSEKNIQDKTFMSFLKDQTIPVKSLENYISYTEQAQAATGKLSGALSTLKSVGINALGSIATMGLTMIASFAIGAIIDAIHDWIYADEIAIEKGKEATQSIEDRYEAYQKLKDSMSDAEKTLTGKDEASGTTEQSIKEIAKEYDELHDGVNELSNANENLSKNIISMPAPAVIPTLFSDLVCGSLIGRSSLTILRPKIEYPNNDVFFAILTFIPDLCTNMKYS